MLTNQDLIGRRIVRPNGELLGTVADLIVDHVARQVLALRVETFPAAAYAAGGATPNRRGAPSTVLPFEAIYDFQGEFVVITNRDDLVPIEKLPRVQAVCAHAHAPSAAPLYDGCGARLGMIDGVRLDAESGALLAYEVRPSSASPSARVVVPADQIVCDPRGTLVTSDVTSALFAQVVAPAERERALGLTPS